MKTKILSITLITFLVLWVFSAIYLSINSIFGIFVDTNPNISKGILGFSFLGIIVSGVVNKTMGGDLTKVSNDLQEMKDKKQKGCKTCKQKK